jgi:hypothetical protein
MISKFFNIFFLYIIFCSRAIAADYGVLNLECKYPKEGSFQSKGYGNLTFDSNALNKSVSITYFLSLAGLEAELTRRPGVKWVKKDKNTYTSPGLVYIIKSIEESKGLIDNACDEALGIFLTNVQSKTIDLMSVSNREITILNVMETIGYQFIFKETEDHSDATEFNQNIRYYFKHQKP